jgi:hypothetical protein
VGWIGLIVAATLHGLHDCSRVNGHWLWIVVTPVSPLEPAEPVAPLEPTGASLARPW